MISTLRFLDGCISAFFYYTSSLHIEIDASSFVVIGMVITFKQIKDKVEKILTILGWLGVNPAEFKSVQTVVRNVIEGHHQFQVGRLCFQLHS